MFFSKTSYLGLHWNALEIPRWHLPWKLGWNWFWRSLLNFVFTFIKFGLSVKRTKFEKKILRSLDKSADLSKLRRIFFSNFVRLTESPNFMNVKTKLRRLLQNQFQPNFHGRCHLGISSAFQCKPKYEVLEKNNI